ETRQLGVDPFYWTIEDFVTGDVLPYVFADAEDERQHYTMVVHNVAAALKDGAPVGTNGEWRIDGVTVRTYRQLVDLIVDRVLDELNKYAPRDGDSPIKEILLDIAERGRSMGIVLIGAQQTASEVERRIISNSSIRVVGRLDPAEAARPEYGYLSAAHQKRAV